MSENMMFFLTDASITYDRRTYRSSIGASDDAGTVQLGKHEGGSEELLRRSVADLQPRDLTTYIIYPDMQTVTNWPTVRCGAVETSCDYGPGVLVSMLTHRKSLRHMVPRICRCELRHSPLDNLKIA